MKNCQLENTTNNCFTYLLTEFVLRVYKFQAKYERCGSTLQKDQMEQAPVLYGPGKWSFLLPSIRRNKALLSNCLEQGLLL